MGAFKFNMNHKTSRTQKEKMSKVSKAWSSHLKTRRADWRNYIKWVGAPTPSSSGAKQDTARKKGRFRATLPFFHRPWYLQTTGTFLTTNNNGIRRSWSEKLKHQEQIIQPPLPQPQLRPPAPHLRPLRQERRRNHHHRGAQPGPRPPRPRRRPLRPRVRRPVPHQARQPRPPVRRLPSPPPLPQRHLLLRRGGGGGPGGRPVAGGFGPERGVQGVRRGRGRVHLGQGAAGGAGEIGAGGGEGDRESGADDHISG